MFCKAKPPNQLLDNYFSTCSTVFMKRNGPLDVCLYSSASLDFGDPALHIAIHTVADEGASHSHPTSHCIPVGQSVEAVACLKGDMVLAIKILKIRKLFFFNQLSALWGTLACRKQSPHIAGICCESVDGSVAAANPSQG